MVFCNSTFNTKMEKTHYSVSHRHLKHLPTVAKEIGIGENLSCDDVLALVRECYTREKEIDDITKEIQNTKKLARLTAKVAESEDKMATKLEAEAEDKKVEVESAKITDPVEKPPSPSPSEMPSIDNRIRAAKERLKQIEKENKEAHKRAPSQWDAHRWKNGGKGLSDVQMKCSYQNSSESQRRQNLADYTMHLAGKI